MRNLRRYVLSLLGLPILSAAALASYTYDEHNRLTQIKSADETITAGDPHLAGLGRQYGR